MKKQIILYIIGVLITIGFGYLAYNYRPIPLVKETPVVEITETPVEIITPAVNQDPYLLNILQQVGTGDFSKLNIEFFDFASDSQMGSYGNLQKNIIYIDPGMSLDSEKTVVAHEYLHYIWDIFISDTDKNYIGKELEYIYERNDYELNNRFAFYVNTNKLTPMEMFSVYCTEVEGYKIASIVDYCNKYINRDNLPLVLLWL